MPLFDPIRRCLVARVVYDGPAFGGKTTNLQQISSFFPVERRSELCTPAALKGRTMFFDWLEIQAGKVGAYPLRIQLLTVPGQGERSYRRRPLLEPADDVVFVCDSPFVHLTITKKSYSQLRASLRKRLPRVVPVLIPASEKVAFFVGSASFTRLKTPSETSRGSSTTSQTLPLQTRNRPSAARRSVPDLHLACAARLRWGTRGRPTRVG